MAESDEKQSTSLPPVGKPEQEPVIEAATAVGVPVMMNMN